MFYGPVLPRTLGRLGYDGPMAVAETATADCLGVRAAALENPAACPRKSREDVRSSRVARIGASLLLSLAMTAGLASTVLAVVPATQLVVLLPGQTASGTAPCYTGTPTAQTVGTPVLVTVNAVDASCAITTATPTVAITSTDLNATLPANAALSAGTGTFSVTFKTAGSSTVTATDQAASPLTPGTSASVLVAKGSQTITFGAAPTGVVAGATGKVVSATGGASGNPVTFSTTSLACAVNSSSGALTLLAVGICTIKADQAGNANYLAAAQASTDITVGQGSQTITFGAPPTGLVIGVTGKFVIATASSGLPVTYSSATPLVCAVDPSSGTLTLLAAGTCVIDANQAGNASYSAATQAQQSVAVSAGTTAQTITFTSTAPIAARVGGATYTPAATATSGLAVAFTIDATASSVCSISAGVVSFIAVGTCVVDANQPGNGTYAAAPQVQQSFTVAAAAVPGTYHPIAPVRLLDTRVNNGFTGKIAANTPATFQVTGFGGVPSYATAVTGNLTVTGSTAGWAVFLGPNPIVSPTSSTINFVAGQVLANGVTVALSATGSLWATYISNTGNTTDLVFDVTGYFTPDTTGGTYHPVAPVRLLDTRVNNGLSTKLAANTPATFQVTGRGGVPSGATAVTGNLTVTGSSAGWAVFLGPDPIASPTSSTINFVAGDIRANGLAVGLSATGTLSATYISTTGNTTDLVFDVTGYFTPDTTGAKYVAVAPARLLDTRVNNGITGKLSANTPATFLVRGLGGVPASATAVTGNLTVTGSTAGWAVFLGPDPISSPTSSTINFVAGDIRANGLAVGLSSIGYLWATYMSTAGNTTDLVFDLTGYFTP
jgi:hypothetical protein